MLLARQVPCLPQATTPAARRPVRAAQQWGRYAQAFSNGGGAPDLLVSEGWAPHRAVVTGEEEEGGGQPYHHPLWAVYEHTKVNDGGFAVTCQRALHNGIT